MKRLPSGATAILRSPIPSPITSTLSTRLALSLSRARATRSRPRDGSNGVGVRANVVSRGYFETMNIGDAVGANLING